MMSERRVSTTRRRALAVPGVCAEQNLGAREGMPAVEPLERANEQLVRFAYSTDGRARRGPVMPRIEDVAALGVAFEDETALRSAPRPLAKAAGRKRTRDR